MAKDLIRTLTDKSKSHEELVEMACHLISEVRVSEEGQANECIIKQGKSTMGAELKKNPYRQ